MLRFLLYFPCFPSVLKLLLSPSVLMRQWFLSNQYFL
jgi:hypothetical protein